MVKTPSRFSPFTLAFRIEVVALVELGWTIMRVDNFNKEENDTAMLLEQEETEEKRERATSWEMKYKRKMAKYHHSSVMPKKLKQGDMVL